jgi:hypothetical protein
VSVDTADDVNVDATENVNVDADKNLDEDVEEDSELLLKQIKTPPKKVRKRCYVVGSGKCIKCKADITVTATECLNCYKRTQKFEITKETLYDLVWIQKLPYVTIGKLYKVSDNAIRKRCKALGIEIRRIKK